MFAPPQNMSAVLLTACWILLLRDRELVTRGIIVWLAMVFPWWTGGKGYPSELVLKSGGPIAFDSRSGVSSLDEVWFWVFLAFFRWTGGCVVVDAE